MSKAWELVIATSCWTIWLTRNELIFKGENLKREVIEFLLVTRVDKWEKASSIVKCGRDPLWRSNPQGALALYNHRMSNDFWKFKFEG